MALMPSRIRGTVIAGAYFFSPSGLGDQEPGGDEREYLMMVPTIPTKTSSWPSCRFSVRATTRRLTTSTTSGPFESSRTSIPVALLQFTEVGNNT